LPPSQRAFDSPEALLDFLAQLRELSGAKPVGLKLCVGRPSDAAALAEAMERTGVKSDFIAIDGGEGGTGAAPPELSDSTGMPMRAGLSLMHDTLVGSALREDIRLIAAGKIATGFDMVRALSLGADLCYSARAMMLAIGCIQARRCHTNEHPVRVATQDASREVALVVDDKAPRVTQFHRVRIRNLIELVGAATNRGSWTAAM